MTDHDSFMANFETALKIKTLYDSAQDRDTVNEILKRFSSTANGAVASMQGKARTEKPKKHRGVDWLHLRERNRSIPGFVAYTEKLREVRQEKQMSQARLSKLAGLTPTALSTIESGFRIPSQERMKILAKALGVSLATFGDISWAPKHHGDHLAKP